jgi:hypothetical protein
MKGRSALLKLVGHAREKMTAMDSFGIKNPISAASDIFATAGFQCRSLDDTHPAKPESLRNRVIHRFFAAQNSVQVTAIDAEA